MAPKMTTTESTDIVPMPMEQQQLPPEPHKPRRSCLSKSVLIILIILIILLTIFLILSFTVFKIKDPTTQIVSTKIEGISPRVILPQFKIDINITLDLQILVHNPNHATFKHGTGGAALVYYNGTQVGVAEIPPGTVPSSGSENISSRVTLEADQFIPEIRELLSDVVAGEIEVETKSTVPGRVKFLGIFHKHVVSVSNCRIVFGISDLKIRQQECNYGIKY